MAILVVVVRRSPGDLDAGHDNKRCENIRGRMDGIGDHGSGMTEDTGDKFAQGQKDVDRDAVPGNAHGDLFTVGSNMQ